MKVWKSLALRLRNLRRGRLSSDIDDETAFHLAMSTEDYVAGGMDRAEALRRARREFGNRAALHEEARNLWTFARIEGWLQDIRYSVRSLSRNRGFTFAAVLTLALGVGMNVAIFSVVYGVLIRPLPYEEGSRLVVLHQEAPRAGIVDVPFSVPELTDYRTMSGTLDAITGIWHSGGRSRR
jgi:hypothetical protein